jgi:hypothetical protein
MDEVFAIQEDGAWLVHDGEDKLETEDLRTHVYGVDHGVLSAKAWHIVAD